VPELSEKRKHESYGKEKQCIVAARKKSLPLYTDGRYTEKNMINKL